MAILDNYNIRFNTANQILEMNIGNETWIPVPITGGSTTPNYDFDAITGQQDLTSPSYASTGAIWVDSGLSCTITPSSNTAAIEISVCGLMQNTSSNQELLMTIFRDTTNLAASVGGVANAQLAIVQQVNGNNEHFDMTCTYIDIPGDTSSHTYTCKLNGSAGVQFTWNGNNVVAVMKVKEIH
jgi:hypothetical protein